MDCVQRDETRRPADLPALTALRGLLAIWVVLYHAVVGLELRGVALSAHAPESVLRLVHSGAIAVEMFFVLSGFVISHVYAQEFTAARSTAQGLSLAARFWWLRIIRLWPVHALVLAAYFIVDMSGFAWPVTTCGNPANRPFPCDRFDVADLPSQLLLIAGWGPALVYRWNFVSWSISAEWLAYVVFPILVLATARVTAALAMPLALAVLATGVPYLLLLGPTFHGLSDSYSAFRVLPGFVAGCLLATASAERGGNGLSNPAATALAVAAVVVLVLLTAASPWPMLATIPGALLIVALATKAPHGLGKALASPPMLALGRMSYSLYVTHFLVLELLGRATRSSRFMTSTTPRLWLSVLASLLICVLVGWLTHRLLEEPARRALRTPLARF